MGDAPFFFWKKEETSITLIKTKLPAETIHVPKDIPNKDIKNNKQTMPTQVWNVYNFEILPTILFYHP